MGLDACGNGRRRVDRNAGGDGSPAPCSIAFRGVLRQFRLKRQRRS
jgi:hypothetical protein